jgi:formylglycine-generating enzyme required for sulfatase activity
VTVATYRQCMKEARGGTKCEAARGTAPSTLCNWEKTDRENHPINCVSWIQAKTFCKWADGYLPTEAQWEYAARGSMGRKYPWGDTPPLNQLCWNGEGNGIGKGERSGTCVADSYSAGASPFGALNMAGNVWEWVADWYAPSYPTEGKTILEAPKDPNVSPESRHVIRGGGWYNDDPSGVRAANRSRVDRDRFSDVGFRCARGQKP